FGKLIQVRVPEDEATSTLRSFDLDVIPVDQEIAFLAGSLIQLNHEYGLSLADRSCLATAISRNEPVVTADRVWANMKHKGIISTG
ncbi:MAG: PIN domain-containing protein, partial [Rhodobacteraceae bacterium]|nr:PIN domain-containing protein [Paracoccaceae bacterium]